MWDFKSFPKEQEVLAKFGKYSTIAGVVMALIGIGAFVYPMYASLVTVAFVAWMMIFAGISTGYFTFISNKEDWLGWLKTLLLVGTGLFVLFDPVSGIAAVGLLFAIYFFLDGFAGFALGSSMKPNKGWWLWSLNGFISIGLGVIFLISWPSIAEEAWLIGIYVGISLFFDSLTLLFMGNNLKKLGQ
jgi:uncharacterized membrane protein HdeD (DUF308 family)